VLYSSALERKGEGGVRGGEFSASPALTGKKSLKKERFQEGGGHHTLAGKKTELRKKERSLP